MGKTIAITGKGGTGKTTICGLLIRHLIGSGRKPVLAIDADPNMNLNEVLGVRVTESIGGITEDTMHNPDALPSGMSKHDFLRFKVHQCLVEASGFDLLAMGRPEGPGCYCFANNVLRDAIDILCDQYPFLVVDNEAGMEHLSRKITQRVDVLLIISDPTLRGIAAAERIKKLVEELDVSVGEMHLIVNRVIGDLPVPVRERIEQDGLHVLGLVPQEEIIAQYDAEGKPLMELPEGASSVRAVSDVLERLSL